MLGKSSNDTNKGFVPKEEQRRLLPSSKSFDRCSSLGFKTNSPLATEEVLFDFLAALTVKIFRSQHDKPNN